MIFLRVLLPFMLLFPGVALAQSSEAVNTMNDILKGIYNVTTELMGSEVFQDLGTVAMSLLFFFAGWRLIKALWATGRNGFTGLVPEIATIFLSIAALTVVISPGTVGLNSSYNFWAQTYSAIQSVVYNVVNSSQALLGRPGEVSPGGLDAVYQSFRGVSNTVKPGGVLPSRASAVDRNDIRSLPPASCEYFLSDQTLPELLNSFPTLSYPNAAMVDCLANATDKAIQDENTVVLTTIKGMLDSQAANTSNRNAQNAGIGGMPLEDIKNEAIKANGWARMDLADTYNAMRCYMDSYRSPINGIVNPASSLNVPAAIKHEGNVIGAPLGYSFCRAFESYSPFEGDYSPLVIKVLRYIIWAIVELTSLLVLIMLMLLTIVPALMIPIALGLYKYFWAAAMFPGQVGNLLNVFKSYFLPWAILPAVVFVLMQIIRAFLIAMTDMALKSLGTVSPIMTLVYSGFLVVAVCIFTLWLLRKSYDISKMAATASFEGLLKLITSVAAPVVQMLVTGASLALSSTLGPVMTGIKSIAGGAASKVSSGASEALRGSLSERNREKYDSMKEKASSAWSASEKDREYVKNLVQSPPVEAQSRLSDRVSIPMPSFSSPARSNESTSFAGGISDSPDSSGSSQYAAATAAGSQEMALQLSTIATANQEMLRTSPIQILQRQQKIQTTLEGLSSNDDLSLRYKEVVARQNALEAQISSTRNLLSEQELRAKNKGLSEEERNSIPLAETRRLLESLTREMSLAKEEQSDMQDRMKLRENLESEYARNEGILSEYKQLHGGSAGLAEDVTGNVSEAVRELREIRQKSIESNELVTAILSFLEENLVPGNGGGLPGQSSAPAENVATGTKEDQDEKNTQKSNKEREPRTPAQSDGTNKDGGNNTAAGQASMDTGGLRSAINSMVRSLENISINASASQKASEKLTASVDKAGSAMTEVSKNTELSTNQNEELIAGSELQTEAMGIVIETSKKSSEATIKSADANEKAAGAASRSVEAMAQAADSTSKTAVSSSKTAESSSKTAESSAKTADATKETAKSVSSVAESSAQTAKNTEGLGNNKTPKK